MTYRQDPPFTLQVYLSEGCNIRVKRPDGTEGLCWECGLNGIRSGPGDYKFMTVETAELIASQVAFAKWNSQLLFAGHGEPSMNPNFVEIIRTFRKALPKTYMVMLSNGAGFIKEGNVQNVFDAGLNCLAIEDYEGAHLAERVKWDPCMPLMRYPAMTDANPHHRTSHKVRRQVILQDIAQATKGTHSTLNNHAGTGMPPTQSHWGKRCAKPFREMAVSWDGTVSGCCIDWRNVLEHGNIHKTPVYDIWQSDSYNAMRRILIQGRRDLIDLCKGCDHPSYRVGLLPDKYGKVKLEEFTQADIDLLNDPSRERKVIPIVLRPWEIASK